MSDFAPSHGHLSIIAMILPKLNGYDRSSVCPPFEAIEDDKHAQ
jgi:hypothetical protein